MNAFDVLKARGFVQQFTAGAPDLLRSDTPCAFYVGFDPTGDSLHVGHLLPVMAMAHLQRAGHRPIAIVGGGTAMIGDPTGRDTGRSMLTNEQLELNKAGLRSQLSLLLDLSEEQGMLIDNADWLCEWNYLAFLREVGVHFPMGPMLAKASVKERLKTGMSFLEFNYQLLQAYDFLELYRRYGCVLQMGGDDQWGNIVAGVDLIRRVEQVEAHALTFPLLTRSDGKKMGKTASGAVWLSADKLSPYDYFQYWINVDDRDVGKLLRIFTFLPIERIEELEAMTGKQVREAKQVLALEATGIIHGKTEAQKALEGARAAFSGGAAKTAMPQHTVTLPIRVTSVLAESGLCQSTSDARRQIKGGAVRLGDVKITDVNHELAELPEDAVLWRGKKKAVRLVEG
ncbi:MAG: tyrosine--tRNA ligase [Proteobacteria bacterium]|nr:tyrosine--tRNA ligase [Pseudomonadota bacterium]MCP4921003.1 tyrosine--tRNA ligase [Pseudomonadota bacterium]